MEVELFDRILIHSLIHGHFFECISINHSFKKPRRDRQPRPSASLSWSATWFWHHSIFTFSLHPDQQNDQKVLGNAMSLQILTLWKSLIN
jgi:hypothetical protein